MRKLALLLALLIGATVPAHAVQQLISLEQYATFQTSYKPLAQDSYYNSWGSVINLGNGSLLAAYSKGVNGSIFGDKIVGITSSDYGGTWSNEFTLYDHPIYSTTGAILFLLTNGHILLKFQMEDAQAKYRQWTILSTGNLTQWSAPREITTNFTSYGYGGASFLQYPDGRILTTLYGKNTGDTYTSVHSVISSDEGATWGTERTVANGQTDWINYDDSGLILSGTTIRAIIRDGNTNPYFRKTISTNWADNWSATSQAFKGTGFPAITLLSDGRDIALYRTWPGPNPASNDVKPAIRLSKDGGDTWSPYEIVLDTSVGQGNMGNVVEVSPGIVAALYFAQMPTGAFRAEGRFRYINSLLSSYETITQLKE